MTFEARLLMEPYIFENYSKYIDMDKLLDFEEAFKVLDGETGQEIFKGLEK